MLSTEYMHDDKGRKVRKAHANSILKQVKSKNEIEEIEFEWKFNSYSHGSSHFTHRQKPRASQPRIIPKLAKKSTQMSIYKDNTTVQEDEKDERSSKNSSHSSSSKKQEKQPTIIEKLRVVRKSRMERLQQRMQLDPARLRRSSKMQFQLDQIVKYSKLYPSTRSSKCMIDSNIAKLLKEEHEAAESSSRFKNTKTKKIRTEKTQRQSKHDPKMLLDIIDPNVMKEEKDDKTINNRKKFMKIISDSKEYCSRSKEPAMYELPNFIQAEMQTLKLKQGRMTETKLKKSSKIHANYFGEGRMSHKVDLREQKVLDVHRFFRGEFADDEQFSDYVSRARIQDFRTKYNIYNSVYKKIKDSLSIQKFNPSKIQLLDMRSAVYLNQSLSESNPMQRRKMLQEICAKSHLVA